MKKYILAIDQGTTSSRAIIFDKEGQIKGMASKEITNIFPNPGWVEQDANEIWLSVLSVISQVVINANIQPDEIASIGITNQRETTIVWDKTTGIPIYNPIVWQSRQSADITDELIEKGYQELISSKTGLPIDAYFSGSKIKWILEKTQANSDNLLFGTVDTWIMWNLSKNKVHKTDYTNASRTMLYNIHELKWDEQLCELLAVPSNILPTVCNSSQVYDVTNPAHFFGLEIAIAGVAGDQQAALFGQACFDKGMMKNTYGTGCFMLMNTGEKPVKSNNGLITTIAWGLNNEITYALEGSIFVAGSAVQWLRDSLELIEKASDSALIASKDNEGVYLVPAFVGLGSPYWDQDVKGAIFGLTRGSGKAQIVRATLESIGFQTKDIVELMIKESTLPIKRLRVDGGATVNEILMQFQSDILDIEIDVPKINETTALGAAFLAGLAVGFYQSTDEIIERTSIDKVYSPQMSETKRQEYYSQWQKAVQAAMLFK